MSDITKAIDKIDTIMESIDYSYIRIETYEKNKHMPIGFKVGGNVE